MTQQLTVLFLEQNGGQREIGTIDKDQLAIGRECPQGISVDAAGVSRVHGVFIRVRSQFLFMDIGSTNGSWVLGKRVEPFRPVVLRAGDTLQLAAAPLKINLSAGVRPDVPSLLAISISGPLTTDAFSSSAQNAVAIEEFPIPGSGLVMTVGGRQTDIDASLIDVPFSEDGEPFFKIVKEDGGLTLECRSPECRLNGVVPTVARVPIGDNDVVAVGQLRVVVNIPPLAPSAVVRGGGLFGKVTAGEAKRDAEGTAILGDSERESLLNLEATTAVFETRALNDHHLGRTGGDPGGTGEIHPSRRFGEPVEPTGALGLSPLEVKLVIIMAVMLFASVFLLGLWWFSQPS